MSEMIANLFEGQPFCNQSSRTGVSQTVGAVMSGLHIEPYFPHIGVRI